MLEGDELLSHEAAEPCTFELGLDAIAPNLEAAYFPYEDVLVGSIGLTVFLVVVIVMRIWLSNADDSQGEASPLLPPPRRTRR